MSTKRRITVYSQQSPTVVRALCGQRAATKTVVCLDTWARARRRSYCALAAIAQDAEVVTIDMIEAAQAIAGVSFDAAEQARLLAILNGPRSHVAARVASVAGAAPRQVSN